MSREYVVKTSKQLAIGASFVATNLMLHYVSGSHLVRSSFFSEMDAEYPRTQLGKSLEVRICHWSKMEEELTFNG